MPLGLTVDHGSFFLGRIRLKLESPNPDGRTAGFVTLTSRTFDPKLPGSTDSTPVHKPSNHHGRDGPKLQEELQRKRVSTLK